MPPASLTDEEMQEMEIHDGLLRFSIGIESEKDLLEDLEQAFNYALNSKY